MNTAAKGKPWGKQVESPPSGKDSGRASRNGSSEEEDGLTQRIVAQVEYYFSDEHILRDSFLLKHVRRNREGYVSLKLMASFRKVKSLTKNWEQVRDALRSSSSLLEVNAEGTKVRRREPLPDHDETAPSRTVVAFPLVERATVGAVAGAFSRCGPISLLGLVRPGGPVPPCAKRFLESHPEASGCAAAVVEFENHEAASLAVRQAGALLNVVPLGSVGSGDDSGGGHPSQRQQRGGAAKSPGAGSPPGPSPSAPSCGYTSSPPRRSMIPGFPNRR
ncbi:la-related protein 6-like [Haemaphysalis longicornis]